MSDVSDDLTVWKIVLQKYFKFVSNIFSSSELSVQLKDNLREVHPRVMVQFCKKLAPLGENNDLLMSLRRKYITNDADDFGTAVPPFCDELRRLFERFINEENIPELYNLLFARNLQTARQNLLVDQGRGDVSASAEAEMLDVGDWKDESRFRFYCRTKSGHSSVTCVEMSLEKNTVIFADEVDGLEVVEFGDAEGDKPCLKVAHPMQSVTSVRCLNQLSNRLLVASHGRNVLLMQWSNNGSISPAHVYLSASFPVWSVDIDADDRCFVAGCDDGKVRLYDLERRWPIELLHHCNTEDAILLVSFASGCSNSCASNCFCFVSTSGSIKVWDRRCKQLAIHFRCPEIIFPTAVAYSDQHIAVTGSRKRFQIYDLRSEKPFRLQQTNSFVQAVGFSTSGKRLFVGGRNRYFVELDLADQEDNPPCTLPVGNEETKKFFEIKKIISSTVVRHHQHHPHDQYHRRHQHHIVSVVVKIHLMQLNYHYEHRFLSERLFFKIPLNYAKIFSSLKKEKYAILNINEIVDIATSRRDANGVLINELARLRIAYEYFFSSKSKEDMIRRILFPAPVKGLYSFRLVSKRNPKIYRIELCPMLHKLYGRYVANLQMNAFHIDVENEKVAVIHASSAFGKPSNFCYIYSGPNDSDLGLAIDNAMRLCGYLGEDIIMYDYMGYGLSSGKPSEENMHKAVTAVYKFATEVLNIPKSFIIPWGVSIGTSASIHLASKFPVRAMILQSAFKSIKYQILKPFYSKSQLFCKNFMKCTCPTLIANGSKDKLIKARHAKKLAKCNEGKVKVIFVKGANHKNVACYKTFWTAMIDFRNELITENEAK
ncbi:Alpha/beta hydrolase domain-containing protein 17A [Trichinella pseudospiralis]|uniref:Alpha/beta hydrolase domain-containing protein 17A n=1 Tax=Trichinella pseudospiralis TaxID=6337 RepID=A0A0V1ES76_TRIPS|nr:Alpha/beta hydrolase domain-containing protein 17A [Trichinella pseudospiralis]